MAIIATLTESPFATAFSSYMHQASEPGRAPAHRLACLVQAHAVACLWHAHEDPGVTAGHDAQCHASSAIRALALTADDWASVASATDRLDWEVDAVLGLPTLRAHTEGSVGYHQP